MYIYEGENITLKMRFNSVIQFRGHLGRRNYGAKLPQQFRRFTMVN